MQWVVLKMLPFDNKSEFQVVVDMPAGTPLERTAATLADLSRYLATVPEVSNYQVYAGLAAPINFNGLVRQYYLRAGAELGDIQVNLVGKNDRSEKSHAIAARLRPQLAAIAARSGAVVKVVEVPPGPPVLAPIVAEIYGPDDAGRLKVAEAVRTAFLRAPGWSMWMPPTSAPRRVRWSPWIARRRRCWAWPTPRSSRRCGPASRDRTPRTCRMQPSIRHRSTCNCRIAHAGTLMRP